MISRMITWVAFSPVFSQIRLSAAATSAGRSIAFLIFGTAIFSTLSFYGNSVCLSGTVADHSEIIVMGFVEINVLTP